MSLIASGGLIRLYRQGNAAKEVVRTVRDEEEFKKYIESIHDVYEASGVENEDLLSIYRSFCPKATFSNLFSARGKKKEKPDTDRLLLGLAVALDAFHTRGVAHGRLQPEYIVVDVDGKVHLCAVGFCNFEDLTATSTCDINKDYLYMPPEDFCGGDYDKAKGDVFSFGSVVYYAILGEHAFSCKNAMMIPKKIAEGVAIPGEVPAKYRQLIEWCWRPAGERPTMGEVVEYLRE